MLQNLFSESSVLHDYTQQLKKNWAWFVAFGLLLVAFGLFCMRHLFISTIVSTEFFGFMLLAAAVLYGIMIFEPSTTLNRVIYIALTALYAYVGISVIYHPLAHILPLTFLIIILLIASGLFRLVFGLFNKIPYRWLIVLSGIISIVLGMLLWASWPFSGFWAIGLFTSINILMTGLSWLSLGLAARNL